MPYKKRRRKRRTSRPSVSTATYTRIIDLGVTPSDEETRLVTVAIPEVSNLEGETVNRKLVAVRGQGIFTAQLATNKATAALFGLRAHAVSDDIPGPDVWDPFDDGPPVSSGSYTGRPSPRPFGRRSIVLATPPGGDAQTISESHGYMTKAERLLRPGWQVSGHLWVRGNGIAVRYWAVLRFTVEG